MRLEDMTMHNERCQVIKDARTLFLISVLRNSAVGVTSKSGSGLDTGPTVRPTVQVLVPYSISTVRQTKDYSTVLLYVRIKNSTSTVLCDAILSVLYDVPVCFT